MNAVDILSLPVAMKGELSSDGETLVYQQSEVSWPKNRWVSQLWRLQLATGETRQLTYASGGSSTPFWSPDGTQLAFLSKRDPDDDTQIYLMYRDGGEARRVVELTSKPSNLTWSPDSKWLYFLSFTEPTPEDQKQLEQKTIIPRFEDPARLKQLSRVEVATGEVQLISGENDSIFEYSLSLDGQELVLLKGPGSLIDQSYEADLWVTDAEGQNAQRLTENHLPEWKARLSPDKSLLAFTAANNDTNEGYYQYNLFLITRETGARKLLAESFPGEVKDFAWDSTGKGLFLAANIGVSTHIFYFELESEELKQMTTGDWTLSEWSYHRPTDTHLFKITSATEPGDYWTMKTGESEPSRVTFIHRDIAERFQLPKQEVVHWKGADGIEVEGLLSYPLDYQEGTPFPLVVDTHGGPQKSDQYGIWHSGRFIPVLANLGYGTLLPNYRGSTGYGDDFLRDMVGSYFRNSHLDVLAGVDHLIELGLVDSEHLVKKGWSAGGHMTNKIITVTDRFQAASTGAGTVDWTSHFGETDTSLRRTWWFGGKPWQENAPSENYLSSSVVKDLWKVKTPTLILCGANDVRVPPSQSKILFRALRDLGVETELYLAPSEPHGWKKPTHRLFRINKELEWFEHHLFGRKYEYQEAPTEE